MGALNDLVRRRASETITYKRQSGHTAAGDATFGAASTMYARVERDASEASDAEGRRVNNATALFTVEELQMGDLVWLAEHDTGDETEALRVVKVTPHRDLNGAVSHWVTLLG